MSSFSQGSLLGGSVHLFWSCQGLVSKAHAQKQRLARKMEVDGGRGCVPLRMQGTLRTLSVSLAERRPPRPLGGRGDTGTYFLWHAGPRSLSPHPTVDPPTATHTQMFAALLPSELGEPRSEG